MKYLLDTNIIVNHLRGKEAISKPLLNEELGISIITWAELVYGVHKSVQKEKNKKLLHSFIVDLSISIVPLDIHIIEQYAQIRLHLEKKGMRVHDFDLFIAATAIQHSLILITRNVKHFSNIPILKIHE